MQTTIIHIFFIFSFINSLETAPLPTIRQPKNLAFLDFVQPDVIDYNSYDVDNEDYMSMGIEENDLSRTVPGRRRTKIRPQQDYNSPIYYIRLPPQPYMFIPGLGYVSQPPQNPASQFVNLPVSFISNGKPSNIYQWSSGFNGFQTAPPPPQRPTLPPHRVKPTKKPLPDSNIHRLPGQFNFNGKPDDIFVLRDSYNSLYSDALQNFYP